MPGPTVGTPAPSLRLPSGQGPEVGLDEYRGRKNVVVWFTKGMACPFCRSQMSQIARAYSEIQTRGGEVLQVSISSPSRAKLYAQKFRIPFPYLADADYGARRDWGLGYRSHGPVYYVQAYIAGARMEAPPNDFGEFMPPLGETPNLLADDDMGFFVVDKSGVVRFALAGSYGAESGARPVPSNEEILRQLERCG